MTQIILEDLFTTALAPLLDQPKLKTTHSDVLAMSCCVYRKQKNDGNFQSFHSINPEDITDEDRRTANDIRKYYGKKYLWSSLNNSSLTEYQKTVFNFLTDDQRDQYLEDREGLIFKLPEFYFNDLVTDEIFKNADVSEIDNIPAFLRQKQTKSLKPVNVIKSRFKRSKENKYWLKDENNRLCLVSISMPNTLEHLWIDIFNNSVTINVNGHYLPRQTSNGDFYKIVDWRLEK